MRCDNVVPVAALLGLTIAMLGVSLVFAIG